MLNFRVPTFTIPCNVVNAERVRPKGPRAKIQFLHAIPPYQKKSSFHGNKMQTNMHTLSLQYHSADDEKMPMMCYHLRSCVPKLVKRSRINFLSFTYFFFFSGLNAPWKRTTTSITGKFPVTFSFSLSTTCFWR